MGLNLTLKIGATVTLSDGMKITVIEVSEFAARLRFEGPPEIRILRDGWKPKNTLQLNAECPKCGKIHNWRKACGSVIVDK